MRFNIIQKIISHLPEMNFQNIEKIFFTLFLFSVPFQTRLTIITPETYLNGTFNEYATFFLYLSDVLFFITLLVFFVNLVISSDNLTKLHDFNIITNIIHSYPRFIPTFTLTITFITWSFVTILWSEYHNMAFYQSLKLLELGIIFTYICIRLPWFGINKFIWIFFVSGFLESIIGIIQFCLQRSLDLRFLMESALSPEIPNVAKIVINGERIIRAYGSFPHPNVFAGFLLLSTLFGIWLIFSHKPSPVYKIVSRETILYTFLIIGTLSQLTALVFTFSRTAWLAAFITTFSIIILIIKSKLFHVKQFTTFVFSKTTTALVLSIIIPFIFVSSINWKYISNRATETNLYHESLDNRALYYTIATKIINENQVLGIGSKNFTLRMQQFTYEKLKSWQFEPVHNIYLLIMCELGMIGLILFLFLLYFTIRDSRILINSKIVSRETILLQFGLISILIGFLFIGMFDHYFWTLQQGQFTFWLLLGAVATLKD